MAEPVPAVSQHVMYIAASASNDGVSRAAAAAAARAAREQLGGRRPDLVFLFSSRHHLEAAEAIHETVNGLLSPRHLVGCSANAVVNGSREFEGQPAVCVWAAVLPRAELASFWLEPRMEEDSLILSGLPDLAPGPGTMVLLPDPFSFPAAEFLEVLADDHPETQVLGGMASSAVAPGQNRLFIGDHVVTKGAVGIQISGGVEIRSLVSQGCSPFGKPMVITRCEDRVIHELGGRTALSKLTEAANRLSPADRALLPHGLHIGMAVDASQVRGDQGEFVVRNVVDINESTGAMSVSHRVRLGQTVRFHVQDARAASAELVSLLRKLRRGGLYAPAGSLLFTCNGRGRRMFAVEDHDAAAITQTFAGLPLGGFFAAGELGPIGSRNFLHGFTAVLALFSPAA